MLYNGIHQIDRAHFLLGARVTAVKAEIRTLVYPVETEDTAVIALTYDSGALGTIVQHKASTQIQSAWETQVFGTEGSLAIRTGESMTWTAAGSTQSEPSSSEDRFLGAATEFVSAIREERPASPSGEDGLAALQVVLGAYEAGQKASPLTAIHYGSRP
jgi:predicted dehydrogenase